MASSGWLPWAGWNAAAVPRAWVKPGEGGAADKANRRLPPDRRSRAGLPSRDRGRRAKRNEDRSAAVAEVRFVDAVAARRTAKRKPATVRVAG